MGDGRKCEAILDEPTLRDECAEDADDCSPNADCSDLVDGFECQCRQGFSGDGRTCTGRPLAQNIWGCASTLRSLPLSYVPVSYLG